MLGDRPPGTARTPDGNLTDLRPKRNRRAEADRHRMARTATHARVVAAMRAAGMEPETWQVEALAASLIASRDEPSDRELIEELMRAPWFPTPRVRRFGVGDPGWRTSS